MLTGPDGSEPSHAESLYNIVRMRYEYGIISPRSGSMMEGKYGYVFV